ncbi:MAG: hypothetical protein N2C14_19345, partial [Planctomycetales bacterium]
SMVDLSEDEDDEFVLGGSDGSDITQRPEGSGIGIGAEGSGIAISGLAESGISLDSGLELIGSSLGADDGGSAFNLTTAQDPLDQDSEDSGSQVIALDQEAELDEGTPTMLGAEEYGAAPSMGLSQPGMPAMSAPMLGPDPSAGFGAAPAAQPMAAPQPTLSQPQVIYAEEVPFSPWNIVALSFCMLIFLFSSLMFWDLVGVNMWHWSGLSKSFMHNNEDILTFLLKTIEGGTGK